MTKKIIAALLALTMLFCAAAFAEETTEMIYELSGTIMEIDENGDLLLNTATNGDVLVHVGDDTILEGMDQYETGMYIYVTFNGVMTMSLPGQINAQKIACYMVEGEVTAIAGLNILLENEDNTFCAVLHGVTEMPFGVGETVQLYVPSLSDGDFAGITVINSNFFSTVAPENARD